MAPGHYRRNNNKISFYYNYDTANNDYDLAQIQDTQGRLTNFDRAGPNQVTRVTDPAGRTYQYGYGTDSSGGSGISQLVELQARWGEETGRSCSAGFRSGGQIRGVRVTE